MRSTRLNKRFYQRVKISAGRKKRETIEDIVRKSYQALPQKYKEMIEDPETIIKATTNIIWVDKGRSISPYAAIKSYAQQRGRMQKMGTKYDLWRAFRTDPSTSAVYNKFNSYMYRNGYSARNYWFSNVEIKVERSVIYATCELPKNSKGVRYDTLEIEFDYSGGEIVAYMTL